MGRGAGRFVGNGGETTGLERSVEIGAARKCGAGIGGLRQDGNDFDGFLDRLLGVLGRVLDDGPMARLGPMVGRKIGDAHSREEETECDDERGGYQKVAATEASNDAC